MPSYGYNPNQGVALNQGAIFNTINGCNQGLIWHEDQTSSAIIRGIPPCPCKNSRKYKVTAIANIALPEGATVVPIAIAFAIDGEVRSTSRAIFTPAAVGDYGNVTASDIIEVPRGCCFRISVQNVSASEEAAYVPASAIDMQNLNITIDPLRN